MQIETELQSIGALMTQHSLRSMLHHSRRYTYYSDHCNLCDSHTLREICTRSDLESKPTIRKGRKSSLGAIFFPVDFRLPGPAAGGLSNELSFLQIENELQSVGALVTQHSLRSMLHHSRRRLLQTLREICVFDQRAYTT